MLAAFEHGDYPLPLLAEHLQPVRDASRTPLFQVSFVMQKETRGVEGLTAFALGEEGVEVGPEDFRLESLSLDRPPAPFDLMLHAVERQGGLSLALQFNTDLFDAATAVRLLDRFALLLRSVVESPELALSALPLLSAAERHQLLHAWNDTAEPGQPEATLYELFAAQAERTPEAEAVVFDEERLTYRELAARARALARHLARLGVGPEVVVGVAAERSVELVAGLLGVLGAGGAYLPLEPEPSPAAPGDDPGGCGAGRRPHPPRPTRTRCRSTPSPVCASPGSTTFEVRPAGRPPARNGSRGRRPTTPPTSSTPRARPAGRRGWSTATAASSTACCGCRRPAAWTRATGSCRRPRSASTSRSRNSSLP